MTRKHRGLESVPDTDEVEIQGAEGLGAFVSGGEVAPGWGALAGGVLATAGIWVAKARRGKSPKMAKYAGLVGLATVGVPGVAALFSKKTRRAGYLGLAVGAVVSIGELVRSMYIEPQLADFGAIEILGDDEYGDYGEYDVDGIGMYQPEMTDGMGAGLEILGQSTPAEAMGMYQPEMTGAIGASPIDVAGALYSGMISAG